MSEDGESCRIDVWLWRARFIYWVMDLNPDEAIAVGWLAPGSPMARFLEALSRWSLRKADRVIVNDKYVKERLEAKGIPGAKIDPVPLWIQDEAVFSAAKRDEFRRTHGLEQKYVVMFAGTHSPCHPLDTLVDAARLLRQGVSRAGEGQGRGGGDGDSQATHETKAPRWPLNERPLASTHHRPGRDPFPMPRE